MYRAATYVQLEVVTGPRSSFKEAKKALAADMPIVYRYVSYIAVENGWNFVACAETVMINVQQITAYASVR
jgi:hypothetical protein